MPVWQWSVTIAVKSFQPTNNYLQSQLLNIIERSSATAITPSLQSNISARHERTIQFNSSVSAQESFQYQFYRICSPPEFDISQFWGWIKSPRSQFHSLLWFSNTHFQLIELRISISRFEEARGESVSVGVEKPFDLFIVVTLVLQLVHVHVLPRSMFFSMISFYQYLTLRAVVKKTKVFLRSGWP